MQIFLSLRSIYLTEKEYHEDVLSQHRRPTTRCGEGAMGRSYQCPKCNKTLNPGTKVVLLIDRNGDSELILLSPELGDYTVVYPLSFEPELGRKYVFRCPVCQSDLTSEINDDLVEIEAETDDGRFERVGFSRTYGERATFVGSGPDHVTLYGDHATRFEAPNFFGEHRHHEDE
jgi:hypothetical protein